MISQPPIREFSISGGIDGDVVDGLDFVLRLVAVDTVKPKPVIEEIPVTRKDTSYMILHEVTEEVYTITEDSWAIQIGAFKQRSLAEGFRRMLVKELGKDVQITIAGEFYRVRILDLPTRAEVDDNVVKLNKLGFKELWIIRLLARQQQRLLITREDSLARINAPAIERVAPVSGAETADVQLGAFRKKSNALALLERLSGKLDQKVSIINEDGYYKVRISVGPAIGQTILEEMKKLMPSIGSLGLKDIWILPFRTQLVEEPVEKQVIEVQKAEVQPDTTIVLAEKKYQNLVKETNPEMAGPSVALQVAIFHKESQALRAQRRITSKLNLPVEIVKQFDYYHVIVTGFYTREETFEYYPELAGLGYPGITLLQNYKSQK